MKNRNVLLLPDWRGSTSEHWLQRWAQAQGYTLVEQHDWQRPLRGDWIVRLQELLLACDEPAVLVAHGLGCLQAAWWAAHSPYADRVKAALLVAPSDVEGEALRPRLPGWAPVARRRLPFPGLLVASADDPWSPPDQAQALAAQWGCTWLGLGACGHFGTDLGDWPQGHALLQELMKD